MLDWSVTPLSADGFEFGDSLPGIELGLDRPARGNHDPAISLLDAKGDLVYQPLTHQSRAVVQPLPVHAAVARCSPGPADRRDPAAAGRFPAAAAVARPSSTSAWPPWPRSSTSRSVPSGPRRWPASRPTWPGGRAARPSAQQIDFRNPIQSGQRAADPGHPGPGQPPVGPRWSGPSPRSTTSPRTGSSTTSRRWPRPPPEEVYLVEYQPSQRAGPAVSAAGGTKRLTASWVAQPSATTSQAYECLCTELGLWSCGSARAGAIGRPGHQLPRSSAGDAHAWTSSCRASAPSARCRWPRSRTRPASCEPPQPAETGLWTYSIEDPPRGWPTADWPTDTPDPPQLAAEYRPPSSRVASPCPPPADGRGESATETREAARGTRAASGALAACSAGLRSPCHPCHPGRHPEPAPPSPACRR